MARVDGTSRVCLCAVVDSVALSSRAIGSDSQTQCNSEDSNFPQSWISGSPGNDVMRFDRTPHTKDLSAEQFLTLPSSSLTLPKGSLIALFYSFSRFHCGAMFASSRILRLLGHRPSQWKLGSSSSLSSSLPQNNYTARIFSTQVQEMLDPPSSHKEIENAAFSDRPRVSVLMELTDRVGVLHDVLKYFWKYDINVSRIESRPVAPASQWGHEGPKFDFFLDFDGSLDDPPVQKLMRDLAPITAKLLVLDEKEVQWFPRHASELDLIAHRVLDAGVDLESDHPGFNDDVYRQRRAQLTENALKHKWDEPIPLVHYTKDEIDTWTCVWDRMEDLWKKHACKEFLHSLNLFKQHCGYSRDNIPQQRDISNYLKKRTNFQMRPVAGLLSSRDFLNGLAFRVFFSTQYIRHHSMPLYTPEPDICHELLGHAPLFADRDFADFSQEIGLASLGASDEDVMKLAHCYWHSVEFGLCREGGKNKAYGAGLLSSFGELEYACDPEHPGADGNPPEFKDWDPEVAATQSFPITTYQPVYFVASSLSDAKQRMREYCEGLQRPFFALHNAQTDTIFIDRPVRRTKGAPQ